MHVNDDGHLDTEDRHLVIKDGINSNHAVSKGQMTRQIEALQKAINFQIQNKIKSPLDTFKVELQRQIRPVLDLLDEASKEK